METCEACEQFRNRVKEWNYWCCDIDPLPHIDAIIKPHKYLIFEGRSSDGAGDYVLVFQCLMCAWWWKLSDWPVFGCLDVLPYLPKRHSTLKKRLLLSKKGVSNQRRPANDEFVKKEFTHGPDLS